VAAAVVGIATRKSGSWVPSLQKDRGINPQLRSEKELSAPIATCLSAAGAPEGRQTLNWQKTNWLL